MLTNLFCGSTGHQQVIIVVHTKIVVVADHIQHLSANITDFIDSCIACIVVNFLPTCVGKKNYYSDSSVILHG